MTMFGILLTVSTMLSNEFFGIFMFDCGNEQIISFMCVVPMNFIVVCVGNTIETFG